MKFIKACLLTIFTLLSISIQGNAFQKNDFDGFKDYDLVFIYVHGFIEYRNVTSFEEKMNDFLGPLDIKSKAVTFRWEMKKIDFSKLVFQWNESKKKADEKSSDLYNFIKKLENRKIPYVLIGYSLGSRLIAGMLDKPGPTLNYLRGIYFLGSAMPHDYKPNMSKIPRREKLTSYYSDFTDSILKICFFNAEGKEAGGEIGFDDKTNFENFRTVCTHIHKGGPLQRDYTELAPAIVYISLYKEKIFIDDGQDNINLDFPVWEGLFHWNDIYSADINGKKIFFQQNLNTGHYRAVDITNGNRTRIAWGKNLHSVFRKAGIFSSYRKTIYRK